MKLIISGLFHAVEFVRDRAHKQPFDPALQVNERIKRHSLAAGVGVYPSGGTVDGKQGDHAIVAPPYIAKAADIDEIVDRFGRGIDAAFRELGA